MSALVLRDVEVAGARCNVLIRGGVVAGIGHDLRTEPAIEEIAGGGAALIPGLHDHHLHLLSLAADLASVRCGAPEVTNAEELGAALRRASSGLPADGWLRGTGYHEQVAGDLDAAALDRLVPDRPVRIQHRSGALWVLNSAALRIAALYLDDSPDVERDASGTPTGRLWRYDARLRPALRPSTPDLAAVGRSLAALGITGVTDATPALDDEALALLRGPDLPQRVHLLGAPLGDPGEDGGPWKIHLRDHDLPDLDSLVAEIARARAADRGVAVHCVTRTSLLLTLTALEQAGSHRQDRIEHASVVPPETHEWMRRLGVTVVTQPGFITDRGDDYLRDVDADDQPCLYPYRSLLAAGIPTVASSDAPYGPLDPWAVIRAARDRRTPVGAVALPHERIDPVVTLAGYLAPLDDPSAGARGLRVGMEADLVLLDAPLKECLADPNAARVQMVWRAGRVIHAAD